MGQQQTNPRLALNPKARVRAGENLMLVSITESVGKASMSRSPVNLQSFFIIA